MALLLDTPSRVLRRVQEYEDMELPSLPSFSHDLDDDDDIDDSEDPYYGGGALSQDNQTVEDDLSTPHVGRYRSPPRTGSTIVPRSRTPPLDAPTPLARNQRESSLGGYTSTPYTEQMRLSSSRQTLSQSTDSRQSRQYSELSESEAESERLPPPDVDDLPEPTLPLDSFDGSTMDTPMPRAFSRRKSPLNLPQVPDSRIPSLSRSEVSGTDNEATTPDGPTRIMEKLEDPTHDYPTHEYPTHEFNTTAHEYNNTSVASVSPPSEAGRLSPPKSGTPSAIRRMDVPNTAARAAATPFTTHMVPLRDITPTFSNRDRETTPSPSGNSPASEYATPRAGSDAADRRKSHLLTVLATSKLPSRFRPRGTPHPARRVSLAPETMSITEEGNSLANSTVDQSFVSIASSQDMTMDRRGSRLHTAHRANTSVPNILLGTGTAASPGGPENRAEFVKIGKHTNMMNTALHEENNKLAQELQEWRDECNWLNDVLKAKGIEVTDEGEVILPNALSQSTLSNKSSSSSASQRKAREDLEATIQQKDEAITDLEQKLAQTDKSGEIATLQKERDDAIAARVELEAEFAQKTQTHATKFMEICGDYDRDIAKLKEELAAATAESRRLETETTDIAELKDKIAQLEDELEKARAEADEHADAAVQASDKARSQISELENENDDLAEQLRAARAEADRLHQEIEDVHKDDDDRVSELKTRLNEAEMAKEDAEAALKAKIESLTQLESLIATKDLEITTKRHIIEDLQHQADGRDEQEADLRVEIADLEATLRKAQTNLADKEAAISSLQAKLEVAEMDVDKSIDIGNNSIVQALEDRLDDAHHEIGRLKGELGSVPARETAIASRDARIKSLEAEKLALQERLRAKELSTSTPTRGGPPVTSTPIVNRVLANLRTPATPGPLKDLSWLQTTIGDSNESMLRAQLEHLQQELDIANTQLDRNFNRLEEAGLGSVELAEKLAQAKDRIADLEEQIRQLAKDNKKSLASLDVGRSKNERLENALDAVHEQMSQLKSDMRDEKERMQDEARRMRIAFKDLQDKADEEIEELGVEIANLRREADDKVADAEEQLQTLRADKDVLNNNFRAARVTIERLEKEIQDLQRSSDDAKRDNRRLQDQTAASARQQETIRSLQAKLREAEADADMLRNTLRERNHSLEAAERQVDTLKSERQRVTRELLAFSDDLTNQRRECAKFGAELEALRAEGSHKVSRGKAEIEQLQSDLRWTKERLETATRQAKAAERDYVAADARAREAERKAGDAEYRIADAEKRASSAVQRANDAEHLAKRAASNGTDVAAENRAKYKAQTRRLAAQIDYLKALYARENTFRHALALQKKFLLLLVGGMSLNEQATLRAIASMGFPVPPPPRPKRTLKSVAIAVIATIRARRVAEEWRETKESRSALTRR